jgi:hypothetical protein
MSPESEHFSTKFLAGNFLGNFNQELHTGEIATHIDHVMSPPHAEISSQEGDGKTQPQVILVLNSKKQGLEIPMVTPAKRRKRREGSMDEDSSSRAECLKAKKNLRCAGYV